ncbi:hypothetical protein PybrP1_012563 [[Pythium] brassicae (nom. inval.)]|nr:hypothetical protein PybrP1_012563 [[Pythium] brassicae (nom. inval.)]
MTGRGYHQPGAAPPFSPTSSERFRNLGNYGDDGRGIGADGAVYDYHGRYYDRGYNRFAEGELEIEARQQQGPRWPRGLGGGAPRPRLETMSERDDIQQQQYERGDAAEGPYTRGGSPLYGQQPPSYDVYARTPSFQEPPAAVHHGHSSSAFGLREPSSSEVEHDRHDAHQLFYPRQHHQQQQFEAPTRVYTGKRKAGEPVDRSLDFDGRASFEPDASRLPPDSAHIIGGRRQPPVSAGSSYFAHRDQSHAAPFAQTRQRYPPPAQHHGDPHHLHRLEDQTSANARALSPSPSPPRQHPATPPPVLPSHGRVIANASRNITFAMLQPHFERPLQEAALHFGVCTTLLKKICRKNGIKNWPYRRICGLHKSIASMEKQVHYFDGEQKQSYAEQLHRLEIELEAYKRIGSAPTAAFTAELGLRGNVAEAKSDDVELVTGYHGSNIDGGEWASNATALSGVSTRVSISSYRYASASSPVPSYAEENVAMRERGQNYYFDTYQEFAGENRVMASTLDLDYDDDSERQHSYAVSCSSVVGGGAEFKCSDGACAHKLTESYSGVMGDGVMLTTSDSTCAHTLALSCIGCLGGGVGGVLITNSAGAIAGSCSGVVDGGGVVGCGVVLTKSDCAGALILARSCSGVESGDEAERRPDSPL